MPDPTPPLPGTGAQDDPASSRRNLLVAGGALGLLGLGAAAYFLLSSGGSTAAGPGPAHRASASASPSQPAAGASPRAGLPVFNGSLGRDPFAVPARVTTALEPPGGATGPAGNGAAPAAPATLPVPLPSGGAPPVAGAGGGLVITSPSSPLGGVGGSTGGTLVLPGSAPAGAGGSPGAPGASPSARPAPAPVQWLQLLAARQTASGWRVDVRTAKGVTTDIPKGTADVGGTQFFFVDEDTQAGQSTFVFTVGDSQGGNLVTSAKAPVAPTKGTIPRPDDTTLVLRRGTVDGGIVPTS